jgi:SAM-dependent methyltransferase
MSAVPHTVESDSASLQIRLNRYAEFDRINGRYLDWQLEQFRPCLGDRILEIGCGIGGILERLPPCSLIHSLDVEEDVLEAARERFKARSECQFSLLDISTCDLSELVQLQTSQFNTIMAINVLEHIEDDVTLLQRAEQLLVPGGYLLLLVPAHQWLYGDYDRLDGHHRRYSLGVLKSVVGQTSFEICRMHYFNLLGAIGWWLHYRLLRRKMHGTRQFGFMSRMIPLMRFAERVVSPPIGLSVVAVLRRPPLSVEVSR